MKKNIVQREDEENLQREAELRLEAEQAERAAEDARLRAVSYTHLTLPTTVIV